MYASYKRCAASAGSISDSFAMAYSTPPRESPLRSGGNIDCSTPFGF